MHRLPTIWERSLAVHLEPVPFFGDDDYAVTRRAPRVGATQAA